LFDTLTGMKSTMQTTPLLISQLLRYGTTLHADQEVVTWTADGGRRLSFADLGTQAAQLAHALRGLGVTGDQRVATFMWNNAEHLTAYLAVPSMGAVLHALNIRLFPEQLIYVTTHGGSEVVIVDNTLAAPFAKLLAHLGTIRQVIVNGPIDAETRAALEAVELTGHGRSLRYNAPAKLQGSLIRVRAERAQFNSVPCQLQRSLASKVAMTASRAPEMASGVEPPDLH